MSSLNPLEYLKAWRARHEALAECVRARGELQGCVSDLAVAYEAHPAPVLAGAAGVGFVLAQLRVGSGLVRTGMRIATGPGWHLLRHFISGLG